MFRKEEKLTLEGKIIEALPNATFRVKIDEGQIVFAYLSGRLRKKHIKVLIEDRVVVEFSPYDLTKGRIIRRIDKK